MSKLVTQAFTNYFEEDEGIIAVTILKYDNNKYAIVVKPDGSITEIKTGYIYANKELTSCLSKLDWFIHGGGDRRDYCARIRKSTYVVFRDDMNTVCTNKRDALKLGSRLAKSYNRPVDISKNVVRGSSFSTGFSFGAISFECFPSGNIVQYGSGSRNRGRWGKYLRGYGKVKRSR